MEGISALINSIATILWPIIVIIILVIFRKSVQALIDSARGRKFAVKIGDMEVSMDELSKQQSVMINDLQKRVNKLQRQLEGKGEDAVGAAVPEEELGFEDRRVEIRRAEDVSGAESKPNAKSVRLDIDDDISNILWVDDNPKNNALLINSLLKSKIKVSTKKNTEDAVEAFDLGDFDCVISDTCRDEDEDENNCLAGFELADRIRKMDEKVPIYIYADDINERMKEKARNVGATAITSSPSELLKLLSD